MAFQIGIDVGGTFTDFVVGNGDAGLWTTKSPSTRGNESEGILNGLNDIAAHYEQDLRALLGDTDVIVLGTTVVTNALLEYKGAKTGLITTGGFRDIIELRRNYRESQFDIHLQPPHPIVPRHLRLGVTERINSRGEIEIALDENEAREAVRRMKELEVESIAVCFFFSFMNSAHEERVAEIIEEEYPGIPVTLSSEILPQIREFERLSTTVVNAYTQPHVERSLGVLNDRLVNAGFAGELFVMHSNGGMVHGDYARSHSVELVMSGPAGGVVAGARVSDASGYRDVITVDMGGTSYDVCLIKDAEPASGTEAWVSRYRIGTPMVDVHTVGSGGGSIAWIDEGGALRVGPHSAGAFPGPACYGRGGENPTITDANVVLGFISPDYFLGGRMQLDKDAAHRAIEEKVAKPLGISVLEAASGIFRIANNSLSNAVRHVTVSRGQDPRDFALCVFGGAGAIHAGAQAPELGIRTILVPKNASVLSALGNHLSDFKITKVKSYIKRTQDLDLEELNAVFGDLLQRAEADMGSQDKLRSSVTRRYIDIRYKNQVHEVSVPIRSRTRRVTELNLRAALADFHDIHEQLYSFKQVDHPTEVMNLRLDLIGVRDAHELQSEPFGSEDASVALKGTRQVYFESNGEYVDVPVYEGLKIEPGQLIPGPAVIEEPDTTVVVYPDQEAMADQYRTYVIEVQ
jgi:N-methylhydantoinase A